MIWQQFFARDCCRYVILLELAEANGINVKGDRFATVSVVAT
jgi:hypothetical protein